jgi:hypothetical protein
MHALKSTIVLLGVVATDAKWLSHAESWKNDCRPVAIAHGWWLLAYCLLLMLAVLWCSVSFLKWTGKHLRNTSLSAKQDMDVGGDGFG